VANKKYVYPLVSFLTFCLFSCASYRKNWVHGDDTHGSFGVDLVVDNSVVPVFEHKGMSYIEGQIGQSYVIRVHNWSKSRIEAVIAVDGRDVIDGRPTSQQKRGYIITPYSYVDVDGFRTNLNNVAAFRFTSVADSYTARMGTPSQVGQITVAIFKEKEYHPAPPPKTLSPLHRNDQLSPGSSKSSIETGGGSAKRLSVPVLAR